MQRKHLRNQNGFSLAEILVALGIFAMLSLGVAMSVSQLFVMQKQISTTDVGDNFSAAFFQHISVPYNCGLAVQGRQLPSGANEIDLDVTTFRGLSPSSPAGVKAGTEVDRGLLVNRLFARRKAGVAQGDLVQIGASPTNDQYARYILQFVLRLDRVDAKGKAHTLPDRVLEVPVLTRPSSPTIISSCMLESGAEDACMTLGGKFVNGLCTFPAECKVQGTFIKTTCSNPNVKCEPEYTGPDRNNAVTGKGSCPVGSCPTQSGRFSVTRSVQTGKKSWSTVTVFENFYICMSCPGKACN